MIVFKFVIISVMIIGYAIGSFIVPFLALAFLAVSHNEQLTTTQFWAVYAASVLAGLLNLKKFYDAYDKAMLEYRQKFQ